MPASVWKKINSFPKVYYLLGSPLKPEDLIKAGIQTARGVIILQSPSLGNNNPNE